MAQFLRPDSNVTQTGFTGGFAEIDEATASDADRAYGTADKIASVLEVGLANPAGAPGAGTTTVRYRLAKVTSANVLDGAGDTVTVTAALYQGTTLIATDTARTATATFTTYAWTPDVSGVTDWTDLRLRFTTAESGGGGGANRRSAAISWAEVEAPDAAAAITGTLAAAETGADDFTASGTVTDPSVTGTLAAQESGADDFTAAGTVAWQPVTGALAATEGGTDDFTALGALAILGAFAATETGADDFTGAGSTSGAISGSLSAFETGSDDFSGSGLILLSGALAASEAGFDGFAGSGTVTDPGAGVIGTLAAIESGADLFSGEGWERITFAEGGKFYRNTRSTTRSGHYRYYR